MGHSNISKLYSLTHYSTCIKEIGTFDSVNILQTEILHKGMKEAYQNSHKVNYVAYIYCWDNQRLLVQVREATLQHLANDKVAGVSQQLLQHVEEEMGATGLEKAMISYFRTLRGETSGSSTSLNHYSALIKARNC